MAEPVLALARDCWPPVRESIGAEFDGHGEVDRGWLRPVCQLKQVGLVRAFDLDSPEFEDRGVPARGRRRQLGGAMMFGTPIQLDSSYFWGYPCCRPFRPLCGGSRWASYVFVSIRISLIVRFSSLGSSDWSSGKVAQLGLCYHLFPAWRSWRAQFSVPSLSREDRGRGSSGERGGRRGQPKASSSSHSFY